MRPATRRLLAVVSCLAGVLAVTGYLVTDDPVEVLRTTATETVSTASELPSFVAVMLDHNATGLQGGELPEDASPFDTHLPGIANLDPSLLAAVQHAARDAREDGIRFVVTSGWRSATYQQQLLEQAIEDYRSEALARRFVATPDRSSHVTGRAVDIGPTDADSWLMQHGAQYGLCQTYANEMWHFELATEPGGVCPRMLPDASGVSAESMLERQQSVPGKR